MSDYIPFSSFHTHNGDDTLPSSNTNISHSKSSHTLFAVLNMCVQVRCVLFDALQDMSTVYVRASTYVLFTICLYLCLHTLCVQHTL